MPDAVETSEIAAAEADGLAKVARVDRFVEQWKIDALHDSPVSRNTDAFNHLTTSALPELRRRILKEFA